MIFRMILFFSIITTSFSIFAGGTSSSGSPKGIWASIECTPNFKNENELGFKGILYVDGNLVGRIYKYSNNTNIEISDLESLELLKSNEEENNLISFYGNHIELIISVPYSSLRKNEILPSYGVLKYSDTQFNTYWSNSFLCSFNFNN